MGEGACERAGCLVAHLLREQGAPWTPLPRASCLWGDEGLRRARPEAEGEVSMGCSGA